MLLCSSSLLPLGRTPREHDPDTPCRRSAAAARDNLHLGHYFGTLANRVSLQRRGVDTFIVIADYQVIADRDGIGPIGARVLSLITDYLAVGLDPERTTIFTHSAVPGLHQLMLPFLSLVTEAELRRNPTVKAEHEATDGRPMSGLLLTSSVHQACDILFSKANLVPVGKDQLPHLEQARAVARRFDQRYGRVVSDSPVFPTPEALLSPAVSLLGLDGHKMSKTRRNTIDLAMDADTTARRIRAAITDDDRHITYDPDRRPEVSNLVLLGALASGREPHDVASDIGHRGAGALNRFVSDSVNEHLAPIRARRAEIAAEPDHLRDVLATGNRRARTFADATLDEVRTAMRVRYEERMPVGFRCSEAFS